MLLIAVACVCGLMLLFVVVIVRFVVPFGVDAWLCCFVLR